MVRGPKSFRLRWCPGVNPPSFKQFSDPNHNPLGTLAHPPPATFAPVNSSSPKCPVVQQSRLNSTDSLSLNPPDEKKFLRFALAAHLLTVFVSSAVNLCGPQRQTIVFVVGFAFCVLEALVLVLSLRPVLIASTTLSLVIQMGFLGWPVFLTIVDSAGFHMGGIVTWSLLCALATKTVKGSGRLAEFQIIVGLGLTLVAGFAFSMEETSQLEWSFVLDMVFPYGLLSLLFRAPQFGLPPLGPSGSDIVPPLARGSTESGCRHLNPLDTPGWRESIQVLEERVSMLEEEKVALKAKAGCVSSLAHEVRTPLNALLACCTLLNDVATSADQRELVNMMLSCGSQISNNVDYVLELARLEGSNIVLESKSFDVTDTCKAALDMVRHLAATKRLDLQLDCPVPLSRTVFGDPNRLRQALLNLLTNSIKFTEKGSVTLTVESVCSPLRVCSPGPCQKGSSFTEGSLSSSSLMHLRLTIADTGIGMSLEQQQKLFRPFAQASEETWGKYGGSGLGLVISQKLITLMGGTVWIDPERTRPKEGSTFVIELSLPTTLSTTPLPRTGSQPSPTSQKLSSSHLGYSSQAYSRSRKGDVSRGSRASSGPPGLGLGSPTAPQRPLSDDDDDEDDDEKEKEAEERGLSNEVTQQASFLDLLPQASTHSTVDPSSPRLIEPPASPAVPQPAFRTATKHLVVDTHQSERNFPGYISTPHSARSYSTTATGATNSGSIPRTFPSHTTRVCENVFDAESARLDVESMPPQSTRSGVSSHYGGIVVAASGGTGGVDNRSGVVVQASSAAMPSLSSFTVLLVEDNSINRAVMARLLSSIGFGTVLTAPDAENALEQHRLARHPIHLIITDINLPGMDGMQFALRIRQSSIAPPPRSAATTPLCGIGSGGGGNDSPQPKPYSSPPHPRPSSAPLATPTGSDAAAAAAVRSPTHPISLARDALTNNRAASITGSHRGTSPPMGGPPRWPVIFGLSGTSGDDMAYAAMQAGMDAYFVKPVTRQQLIQATARWLLQSGHS